MPNYATDTDGPRELAYVVIMRHGERSLDKSDNGLTEDGTKRALYINKCVSHKGASAAFPLGAPTHLLASTRGKDGSHRPVDTLSPLAKTLKLPIGKADMFDIYAPLTKLSSLAAGDTLLVVWQVRAPSRGTAAVSPRASVASPRRM